MTPAVELAGLRVVVGERTLLDVPRLHVATGECVAVVGPNGAGKSTLLAVIGALAEIREGHARVLGRSIGPGLPPAATAPASPHCAERRALRREIGLLMQGLHLVPRLTALENVVVGGLGRLRGVRALRSWWRRYPRELVAEAEAALAALGLADRATIRADRLSGGERQKVALARLRLQRPRLLLADEPTSALDPAATREVCLALRTMASESGRTLLVVVHDLELLPLLATRVVGMSDGRVCWDRPIAEVSAPLLDALYAPRTDGGADPRGAGPIPLRAVAPARSAVCDPSPDDTMPPGAALERYPPQYP